jgi:hypothetical protein
VTVNLRKLAPEEAQRVFPRRGHQDLSEYVAALRALHPGEAAGIEREGVPDRAIKRRLSMAAKQLGYRLKWGRHSDAEMLYFRSSPPRPRRPATAVDDAQLRYPPLHRRRHAPLSRLHRRPDAAVVIERHKTAARHVGRLTARGDAHLRR